MNVLGERLGRLAERGPHADPNVVVAGAVARAAGDVVADRQLDRPRRGVALAMACLVMVLAAAGLLALVTADRAAAPASPSGSSPTDDHHDTGALDDPRVGAERRTGGVARRGRCSDHRERSGPDVVVSTATRPRRGLVQSPRRPVDALLPYTRPGSQHGRAGDAHSPRPGAPGIQLGSVDDHPGLRSERPPSAVHFRSGR